jgi:hypothetical protein
MQDALSEVLSGSPSNGEPVNIMIQVRGVEQTIVDFLGPDIDAGFRIAQHADKRKLTIAANLAETLLLYSPQKSIEGLRIVGYRELKGVWNGRPYPIIWFYSDWSKIGDTFYYDDRDKSDIFRDVLDGKTEAVSVLDKIYTDLNRGEEINAIAHAIKETPPEEDNVVSAEINPVKLAEVHCAAVCFRPDGCILIARRPTTKRKFFEFGCGQVRLGQDFHDAIREGYKEDFSAELDFISKNPVNSYVIYGDRKVPGLLFYAELKNPDEVERNFLKSKHTEVRWLVPADVGTLDESEVVPDFAETVRRALKISEQRRKANPARAVQEGPASSAIGRSSTPCTAPARSPTTGRCG